MENEDVARAVAQEVQYTVAEIQFSTKRTLQRICQLKDTISIEEKKMKFLVTTEEKLKNYLKPIKIRASLADRIEDSKQLKVLLEKVRSEHLALNLTLDEYEKNSPNYNVPEDHGEPLPKYLARLSHFMKLSWKKPAQENIKKGQRSLVEWMKWMEQTLEPNKGAFESSLTLLINLGIQVSKLLSEYAMLVMLVFCKNDYISEALYKVECILKCLSVESNSIVIDTFVSVVQSLGETLRLATVLYEDKQLKERNVQLENEIVRGLPHLIIREVLRLEVDFCYPHMMIFYNPVFVTPIHLKNNIFKDKLSGVSDKINELKKEMLSIQEDFSMKGFIHQALDVRVQEEWNKVIPLLRLSKPEVRGELQSEERFEDLFKALYEYWKKFKKCNVPERFGEPLEQYMKGIDWFKLKNWNCAVSYARLKRRRSLVECMLKIDQSEVQNKTVFDELKTLFIDLGTQISKFLIEYFMLLMAVSEKNEVLATLNEVKTILRHLSLEQNTIVINTFISVVQSFETILLATTIPDEAKVKGKIEEETCKEITSRLPDLLHLIIIEAFRLEVSFCSPHSPGTVTLCKLLLAVAIYLKDVFKVKLTQINELNKYKLLIQEEVSSMEGFLHQALELRDIGVQKEWCKVLEPKPSAGT